MVSQSFSLSNSLSGSESIRLSTNLYSMVVCLYKQINIRGYWLPYGFPRFLLWRSDYISAGADNKPHFANPAAVQRAASVLGATKEDITEIIFAPPIVNQFTVRMRRQSQSRNDLSPSSSADNTPERQARSTAVQYIEALEGFAMGLYQEAFAALIRFINR